MFISLANQTLYPRTASLVDVFGGFGATAPFPHINGAAEDSGAHDTQSITSVSAFYERNSD